MDGWMEEGRNERRTGRREDEDVKENVEDVMRTKRLPAGTHSYLRITMTIFITTHTHTLLSCMFLCLTV